MRRVLRPFNSSFGVTKASTGFARPSYNYTSIYFRCFSKIHVDALPNHHQSKRSKVKRKDGRSETSTTMSAEESGAQWVYQPPPSFNPVAPNFVPPQYQDGVPGQLSAEVTASYLSIINNQAGINLPPHAAPPQTSHLSTLSDPNSNGANMAPSNRTRSKRHSKRDHSKREDSKREEREKEKERDPIRPPSDESGGVPSPTTEYLIGASLPPFQLPYARKLLVVIDLNGTLLYRPSRHNPSSFIERPHARTFLRYCIKTFKVVIWSSAKPNNVNRMCKQLLPPEVRQHVVAAWGRDRFGLSPDDYNSRVMCYKRLDTLWNDPNVAASHPTAATGGRWSQADTVLVDDSLEKARAQPYNLVQIPEFMGDPAVPEEQNVLPQVHDYINECSRYVDVSTHIRDRPFSVQLGWQLKPASAQEE